MEETQASVRSAVARHGSATAPWHRDWAAETTLRWVADLAAELCLGSTFPALAALNERVHTACDQAGVPRVTLCANALKAKCAAQDRTTQHTYDGMIVQHGVVPSRPDNWHDLMNALSWVAYPRAKWALHRAQYSALCDEVARNGGRRPANRGRLRDHLTLLDEAGALRITVLPVDTASSSPSAVREPSGEARRGEQVIVPFGHALYENAALRRPDVTPWYFEVDAALGARLQHIGGAAWDMSAAALGHARASIDTALADAITRRLSVDTGQDGPRGAAVSGPP